MDNKLTYKHQGELLTNAFQDRIYMLDGLHTAMMASITCQNNQYVIIITNITGLYYWDPGERHSLSVSQRSQQSNFSRLDSDPRQCASLVLSN